MILKMKLILLIFFIGLLGHIKLVNANSNIQNLYLEKLSVENGLSQGTVNSILADKNGLIWLATESGINIYDGYSLKQLSGPNNKFLDTSVYLVEQDSDGLIWLMVDKGLYSYNAQSHSYKLILADDPNNADYFVMDLDKGTNEEGLEGYWLATTKTLGFYTKSSGQFQMELDLSAELPAKENIYHIKYHKKILYIATRIGVYAYHVTLKQWRKLPDIVSSSRYNQTEANKNYVLYVSANSDLYMGTNDGVFSQNITQIENYIQKGTGLAERKLVLENNSVWRFLFTDERLYVASNKGLHTINVNNQETKRLFGYSDFFENITDDTITSLTKDKSGVFWLGSNSTGAYSWDPSRELIQNYRYQRNKSNSLSHNEIWALTPQKNDNQQFWVGTRTGLDLVDTEKQTIEQYLVNSELENQFSETHINRIYHYGQHQLLLATAKGVVLFDTTSKRFVDFSFEPNVDAILAKNHDSAILHDERYLWLVHDEGLSLVDLKTGILDDLTEIEHIISHSKIFSFLGMLPNSQEMLFSSNDTLWSFNLTTREVVQRYQHPGVAASEWLSFESWDIDKNNVFWVSYPRKGLIGFEYPSFKIKYFFHKDNSIIENNVYGVMADNNGDIWFSTHSGLFLLNSDSQHIRNFTINDGLRAMEFNSGAAVKLHDGRLAYGSMEGVSVFNPQKLKNKHQENQLNVYVTGISVISRSLDLPLIIDKQKEIFLNYDDVGIRFDFSTLASAGAEGIIFEYQLTGESNVSYPATRENKIIFPSLESGQHTLLVRVKSPVSGKYSAMIQVKINVSYAPWKSPLAYSLYLLFLLALLFIWLQRRNEQKKQLLAVHEEVKFRENRLQLALIGSNSEVWDWQAKDNLMFGKRISQELSYVDLATAHTFEQHVELIHPDDKDNFLAQWLLFVEQNVLDETFSCTYRLKHAEGHWLWYKDLGKIVSQDHKNKPSRITGSYTNITKTRAAEVRSQYYGEAFKQTNDWVLIVNDDFTRITANQSLRNVFGLSDENFSVNHNFMGLSERRWRFFQHLFLSLNEGEHWRGEELVVADSGEEFHVVININVGINKTTNSLHYVCVFTDISAQKSAEKELRYLANYDHLTDLPNRSLLLDRIKHAMESSQRKNNSIALFFIDLDRFKQVNDSLGHDCGDMLLVEVTRRLSELLRVDDTVARIGGDEFVVLLESFRGTNYLGQVAQKIIAAVGQPVLLQGNEVSIGASIGIALYPDDARDSSALLRHADVAMYHAKQLGRNTFQFFTPRMNAEASERLTKESNVKLAYANDEFFNHYQPIVDAHTGKASGFELLMRWQSKQGLIAPSGFIGVAEELGLIIPMTEAALERGLVDLMRWHKQRPSLYLSVNLSPSHFAKESLVPYIAKLLQNNNLPAYLLKIEVTESALLSEPDKAIKTMNALSELGVILALDDFGTGFSSLSYLKRLPLDIIKIDRSFVSGIGIEKTDEAIVDATIVLAKRLNMHCIAEGVETAEQLQYLTKRECHYIQGYLYSKPVDAQTIDDYLSVNTIELKAN